MDKSVRLVVSEVEPSVKFVKFIKIVAREVKQLNVGAV